MSKSKPSKFLYFYAKFMSKKSFYNFNLKLYRIALRGLGINNYETEKASGEHYFLSHILPTLLPTCDSTILFDVGANIGNYSKMLINQFPKSDIYAFEPHPITFQKLSKNSGFKSFQMALSNSIGKFFFYDSDKNGTEHASLHKEVISEMHCTEIFEFEVECNTLDSFCESQKIPHINFLKIDTEGNELAVLQGASSMINNKSINIIQFEFNEMNVVSKVFFKDFVDQLPDFNFYRLFTDGMKKLEYSVFECEIFVFQNIVAIRKEIDKNIH